VEPKDGLSTAPEALIKGEDGTWENGQIVPMSISHDEEYATAVCMAAEEDSTLREPKDGEFEDLQQLVERLERKRRSRARTKRILTGQRGSGELIERIRQMLEEEVVQGKEDSSGKTSIP
jgi:hypothetical protein